QKLAELDAAVKKIDTQLQAPLPMVDAAQAAWEKTVGVEKQIIAWTALDPGEVRSKGGATLTKLKDLSILASGPNPNTEVYTVTAATDLAGITAIRLEVLPDDSLTARGPGRSINGNLVLTNVRLFVIEEGKEKAVKLVSASADFSQKDFPVANAL